MTMNCLLQMTLFVAVLLACVKPLGLFMAKVYSGRAPAWSRSWALGSDWCIASAGSVGTAR